MDASDVADPLGLMSTGIAGPDDVLGGGLTPNRLHLLEGTPGAGKTTITLQFLMEGARRGESVLYVTLSETELQGPAQTGGHRRLDPHPRTFCPPQRLT